MQAPERFVRILHEYRFGQFKLEQWRAQSSRAQRVADHLHEIGLLELQRRHVDRHRHRRAGVLPRSRLAYRLFQHPVADRDDEPGLLGQRDEDGGRNLPQFRVAPPDQRLSAYHGAGGEGDLGLVVQPEAPLLHGQAHGMVHFHARQHIDVHLRLVKAEIPAPAFLDAVHRDVRILDQLVERLAVLRVQRHANAAANRETHAVDLERAGQRLEDALRAGLGTVRVGLLEEYHELITAEPAQGVDIAQALLYAIGHFDQHTVAKGVAHRIVDVLEPVQVQEEDRELAAVALGHAQREIDTLRQHQPVRQAGKYVAVGQRFYALLGRVFFGQVLEKTYAVRRMARLATQQNPGQLHRSRTAAFALAPDLPLPEPVGAQMLLHAHKEAEIVRVVEHLACRAAQQLRLRRPGQPLARRIRRQQQVVRPADENRVETGLEHLGSQPQAGFGVDPLADIAKREDASTGLAPAVLRPGHAFDGAPRAQFERVGRLEQRQLRKLIESCLVLGAILDHRRQMCEQRCIVALEHQMVGHLPQLGEAPVVVADPAFEIDRQNPVGRGLQRGAQLRKQALEHVLGIALVAQVAHTDQENRCATLWPDPADTALDRDRYTVRAPHQGLRKNALGQPGGDVLPKEHVLRRRREFNGRFSYQFLARKAHQVERGLVHGNDAKPHGVHHPHRFDQAVDERSPGHGAAHRGTFALRAAVPSTVGRPCAAHAPPAVRRDSTARSKK